MAAKRKRVDRTIPYAVRKLRLGPERDKAMAELPLSTGPELTDRDKEILQARARVQLHS